MYCLYHDIHVTYRLFPSFAVANTLLAAAPAYCMERKIPYLRLNTSQGYAKT